MKKFFLILGIILASILLFVGVYQVYEEITCPKPEITYGEFPFRLVYKLNGEEHVVEDTVVCKYKRSKFDFETGIHHVWKTTLASDSKRDAVLILKDGTKSIYCYVGEAEYYMGDKDGYYGATPFVPRVYETDLIPRFEIEAFLMIKMQTVSQEEILEKYNIEIISWEFSDPIKNEFS